MRAIHLRTDDLQNPLGLGDTTPEFGWHCEGGRTQSAYQIVAYRLEPEPPARQQGEKSTGTDRTRTQVWDSGKVLSPSMTHIIYRGETLRSRDRIEWQVRLWDENDRPGDWSSAGFEMGLLDAADWHARWISGDYKPRKNERYPVDCFRREIPLEDHVVQARLYITACGFYEAYMDTQLVGNYVLAPGCTDYRYRLQYQTYDVTDLLAGHAGQNGESDVTLELFLGDGWYRGSVGCFGKTNVFGRQTKILAQLEIVYESAGRRTIGTDTTFAWSNDGPVIRNDFKDGEVVDAARKPSYSGRAREVAFALTPTAADNVPVTMHESYPGRLLVTPSGRKVLDFGQNMAGFVTFHVHGHKGQQLKLTMGEMLDAEGEFTQENMVSHKPVREFGQMTEILLMTGNESRIRKEMQNTPLQQVVFTCSGGEDVYRTRFALFGFRYALVETDLPFAEESVDEVPSDVGEGMLRAADFQAVAVYSDMEETGSFLCSNPAVNRLYSNIVHSMRGNFIDIPMDCPTRERLGWTGDAQIFFRSAAYLYDVSTFYRKWLRDLRDGQYKSGKMSAVVPYNGFAMLYDNTGASVGWADAVILIPYRFYRVYGDRRVLEESYEMCKNYANFMIRQSGPAGKKDYANIPHRKYLYEKGFHLGEWLEPEEFQDHIAAGVKIKHTEIATAYLYLSMSCMVEIARILGHEADAGRFAEYADGAKAAYQELFLQEVPRTNRQAVLVRPLAFGLVPEESREAFTQQLVRALEYYDYRVGTGFLSTAFLLPVLTQNGQTDVAYRVLENEQKPGWLYEVKEGATTVWENWEGNLSQNHYSPGAVCEWLFSDMGGIRISGENAFEIRPVPGGDLTYAQVAYDSPYGRVEVRWERAGSGCHYEVSVPANTMATIVLPGQEARVVAAGTYSFDMPDH